MVFVIAQGVWVVMYNTDGPHCSQPQCNRSASPHPQHYCTNSDLSRAEFSALFKTTLEDLISSGGFACEAMNRIGESGYLTSSESRRLPNEMHRLSGHGTRKVGHTPVRLVMRDRMRLS